MYMECSEIKGTKVIVSKRDANAVQKVLFNCGYGYELNLAKDFSLRKYKTDVCFFIDYNGIITVSEKKSALDEDFWEEFYASSFEEINWEALF